MTTLDVGELRGIAEVRSAPSARLVDAQIVNDNGRHVLRLRLRFLCYYTSETDSFGRSVGSSSKITGVAVQAPGELGLLPRTDGGSNPPTCEKGEPGMMFGNSTDTFDLTGFLVARAPAEALSSPIAYWYAYPSLGAAGTLSGGTLTIKSFVHMTSSSYGDSGTPNDPNDDVHYSSNTVDELVTTLNIQKLLCEAVSLDSRLTYGQPNLEGALVSDPNAELGHVSFKDWIYKGGAFVGNMPTGSGDLSGEGRLQIRYTGTVPSTTYVGACLTAFATERKLTGAKASTTASTAYVGLYRPNSTDPNLNLGDQVRWGTRWNIQPQTTATDPVDFTKNASEWFEITDAMQGEYVNWLMPYKGGPLGGPLNEMWTHCALALPQLYGPTWQSFSTTQYQNTSGAQFPIIDSAVRIWRVGLVTP